MTPQKHPNMQKISNLRILSPAIINPKIAAQNGAVLFNMEKVAIGIFINVMTMRVYPVVPTIHLKSNILYMDGLTCFVKLSPPYRH